MAVLELNALSVDLAGSFSATVIMPENAAMTGDKKYAALYFLHDIGGNDTDIRTVKGLEALASQLGIFIIAPSVMHSFGLDLTWGGKYGHFVAKELPGICKHMFPIDPERTYVGGTGWGAWGAVMQAAENPDAFSGCIALSGNYDMAALCSDALTGKELPHLSVPMLEALFAPLDGVAGGRFDLLSGSHAMPERLYVGCEQRNLTCSEALAKTAKAAIHVADSEQDLYAAAIRWLCE